MAGNMVFAVNQEAADFNRQVGNSGTSGLVSNCLPVVMLWLQQTMVHGNMQNDAILRSNKSLITMRQSALHYKLITDRPAAPMFDIGKAKELFLQFKLNELREGSSDLFDFSSPGEVMSSLPGYYLLYIRNADDTQDHAFGFKFTTQSGNYFFDPDAGLYHYPNVDDLLLNLSYLNTTRYYDFIGGQYWFKQLILGQGHSAFS